MFSRLLAGVLALCSLASLALADVEIKTLGGGRLTSTGLDFGFVDGKTLESSQFHTPAALAVDAAGLIYLADLDNGAIRRLDVGKNRSTTLLSELNQPAGLAIAGPNDLYFTTKGDGRVLKLDRFGTLKVIASGLYAPTALTVDVRTNIFVTEERGTIVRINAANGGTTVVASGLSQPGGIAVLSNGLLAVSDTGRNSIRFIDPRNGQTTLKVGTGTAGFHDGPPDIAQFNGPLQIARAPNGSLVVADRWNHRLRLIDVQGTVTTIIGIDSDAWEGPECLTCTPVILPGWYDSTADFAESREPAGVAITSDGTVYSTEVYYHIVREVNGVSFVGDTEPGETELVVLPPTLSPNSGFYPMGQTISIVNPNSNSLLTSSIYYTTDGSDPTTNSFRLPLKGDTGSLFWASGVRDLTSLKVRAYLGDTPSAVASGEPSPVSVIGVSRDVSAGMGSTLILPVVVNLRTNDPLKSLQFRVEVTPASPGAPMIPATFDALNISTNDFITVATSDKGSSTSGTSQATFNVSPYTLGETRGLVITMIGTNSNFSTKEFSVVAMLSVPVPTNAAAGALYSIAVVKPSATSDGNQTSVPLTPMPTRIITVEHLSYAVGDSALGIWYNADLPGLSFGDGELDNADVNNTLNASLGVRVPYLSSDLFNAMDAYPVDTEGSAGGDGLIRFLDWQVLLMRSLGFDSSRWIRTWSDGGGRTAHNAAASTTRSLHSTPSSVVVNPAPGSVWYRQATIKATTLEAVQRGSLVDVPVHVTVLPGEKLAGLAFRALVHAEGGAPALVTPIQFIPGPNIPEPIQNGGLSAGDLLCGWSLVPSPAFKPVLEGTRLLGYLRVTLPSWASQGQSYTVHFQNADGAPNLQTQYDIETVPASLWVMAPARTPASPVSDEWKLHFFGSLTAADAQPEADPDGDTRTNLQEYQSGTNPTDKSSCLRLDAPTWDAAQGQVVLRWMSAPGKTYTIESSSDLLTGSWTTQASNVPGTGFIATFPISDSTPTGRFYRLRIQP